MGRMSGTMRRELVRKITSNPELTDEELSVEFNVGLPTIAKYRAENVDKTPEQLEQELAEVPVSTRKSSGTIRRRKVATGQIDQKALYALHETVVLLVNGLSAFLLVQDKRMLPHEIDAVFLPAERIILRRFDVAGALNPDMIDGLACLMGVLAYVARVGVPTKPRAERAGSPGTNRNGHRDTAQATPTPRVQPPQSGSAGGFPGQTTANDILANLYESVGGSTAANNLAASAVDLQDIG